MLFWFPLRRPRDSFLSPSLSLCRFVSSLQTVSRETASIDSSILTRARARTTIDDIDYEITPLPFTSPVPPREFAAACLLLCIVATFGVLCTYSSRA